MGEEIQGLDPQLLLIVNTNSGFSPWLFYVDGNGNPPTEAVAKYSARLRHKKESHHRD
jgi:hypothetical protein